jgi:hypothetical protein
MPERGAAILRAEILSRIQGNIDAIAFSRTGDPDAGKFDDAVVLKRFGDVPPYDDVALICRNAGFSSVHHESLPRCTANDHACIAPTASRFGRRGIVAQLWGHP